jgi:hypothetical protein
MGCCGYPHQPVLATAGRVTCEGGAVWWNLKHRREELRSAVPSFSRLATNDRPGEVGMGAGFFLGLPLGNGGPALLIGVG